MRAGEHAAERGEVAGASELEIFQQQVCLVTRDAMGERRWRAQAGIAQGAQSIGFSGERVFLAGRISLEKTAPAGNDDGVAAVDAASGCRGGLLDPKLVQQRRA